MKIERDSRNDNMRRVVMDAIEDHFRDFVNNVFMTMIDRKPTPEEKYLIIKNMMYYIKNEYPDLFYKFNLKESKKRMNRVRFVLKESRVHGAAGILAVNVRNRQVLVGRRGGEVSNPGVWVFPGGKIERGESTRRAAMREFGEETWYTGRYENMTRLYKQTGEFDYSLYIATVGNFSPRMDDREFDEMMWVDFDQFLSMNPKHPRLEEALNDESILKKIKNYIGKLM